jgi:hypothetical protein
VDGRGSQALKVDRWMEMADRWRGGRKEEGAVLLVLGRRRWACKVALPLAVLLARATQPSGWGVLAGVLRSEGCLLMLV